MKHIVFTLIFTFFYSIIHCCSFSPFSFCNTVNTETPNNIIVRGYFSDQMTNGLVFTRIETLRGDEDRGEIKIWDNVPFDCNGWHFRLASYMGNIDEEVILSITQIDSVYFEGETVGDYRVPEGLYWETHSLKVLGDSVSGFLFPQDPPYFPNYETIHYDEFINSVIDNAQCSTTSTNILNTVQINIYPTLVNDMINIEYNFTFKGKIEIYNLSGQKMLSNNLSSTINLATLTKGMYIVVIQTSDNRHFRKKIIKI